MRSVTNASHHRLWRWGLSWLLWVVVASGPSTQVMAAPIHSIGLPLRSSSSAMSLLLTSHITLGGRRKNNNNNNNKPAKLTTTKTKQVQVEKRSSPLGFGSLDRTGCIVLALAVAMSYKHWDHIPHQHFAFAVAYPLYLGLVNRLRFQRNLSAREQVARGDSRVMAVRSLLFQGKGIWFIIYVHVFAVIGMLLPLILCLAGPNAIAAPAASHTMLIFAQVLTEGLSVSPFMHAQPKLMVPIGFNIYRMATLWSWVKGSWEIAQRTLQQQSSPIGLGTKMWVAFAFVLGVTNLVAWSYNLFVFLSLRVVPQYWDTTTFPTAEVRWKGQLFPVAG